MWSRPEAYSNEPLRPATPTLRWRWAGRTTPSCLQSSVWRDWARTWRKHEPGTKRPRALAQRKQHGGWPFLQIVSALDGSDWSDTAPPGEYQIWVRCGHRRWRRSGGANFKLPTALSTETLPERKVACITAFTSEVARHANPAALEAVNRELLGGLAAAADRLFFRYVVDTVGAADIGGSGTAAVDI